MGRSGAISRTVALARCRPGWVWQQRAPFHRRGHPSRHAPRSRPHSTSPSISLATRLVRSSPSSWLPPRRARVLSLTLVEPPSYRFVDDPGIAHLADLGDDLWNDVELLDADWLLEFFDAFGEEPPSQELINLLQPHVPPFRRFVTRPWDIHLPVEMIKSAGVPSLVISGGHHSAVELLNDRIAEAIGARRTVVKGAGHEVQMTGTPFNERIQDFLRDPDRPPVNA